MMLRWCYTDTHERHKPFERVVARTSISQTALLTCLVVCVCELLSPRVHFLLPYNSSVCVPFIMQWSEFKCTDWIFANIHKWTSAKRAASPSSVFLLGTQAWRDRLQFRNGYSSKLYMWVIWSLSHEIEWGEYGESSDTLRARQYSSRWCWNMDEKLLRLPFYVSECWSPSRVPLWVCMYGYWSSRAGISYSTAAAARECMRLVMWIVDGKALGDSSVRFSSHTVSHNTHVLYYMCALSPIFPSMDQVIIVDACAHTFQSRFGHWSIRSLCFVPIDVWVRRHWCRFQNNTNFCLATSGDFVMLWIYDIHRVYGSSTTSIIFALLLVRLILQSGVAKDRLFCVISCQSSDVFFR